MAGIIALPILFVATMELLLRQSHAFWQIASIATLLVLLTLPIVFRRQFHAAVFAFLWYAASLGFFLLVPAGVIAHAYSALAGSMFFVVLYFLKHGKHATAFIRLAVLVTSFFSFSIIMGLTLYVHVPLIVALAVLVVSTFGISFYAFYFSGMKRHHSVRSAAALSFISAELLWALAFWPTGILAASSVLFGLFYVFTEVVKGHTKGSLTPKALVGHIAVALFVVGVALSTSQWQY